LPTFELQLGISPEELLERFVSKSHIAGTRLRWQALRLRESDNGGMSVARLLIGVAGCKIAGESTFTNGVHCFAETITAAMRSLGHEVVATPGTFDGHAEIRLAGLDSSWPIRAAFEPGPASEEKLAEVGYYEALLPYFRFRSLTEPGGADADIVVEPGGTLSPGSNS